MQELREELLEVAQQVTDLQIQKDGRTELEQALDEKDMQSLRDDVQFYQAENLELSLKCKALVIRNNEMVIQIKNSASRTNEVKQSSDDKSIELSIIEGSKELNDLLADSDEEIDTDTKNKSESNQMMGGSYEQTVQKMEALITEFCKL